MFEPENMVSSAYSCFCAQGSLLVWLGGQFWTNFGQILGQFPRIKTAVESCKASTFSAILFVLQIYFDGSYSPTMHWGYSRQLLANLVGKFNALGPTDMKLLGFHGTTPWQGLVLHSLIYIGEI